MTKTLSDFPRLLQEWVFDKNNDLGLDPDKIYCGSYKKAFWKCSNCGLVWLAAINNRAMNGTNCFECSRKIRAIKARQTRIQKQGSLLDCFPDVAREVHPESPIQAHEITYGSKTIIDWLCHVCGNIWKTSPNTRTNTKSGCPKCSTYKKINSYKLTILNDKTRTFLKTTEIAKEYDHHKNTTPIEEVLACSGKYYWWICSKCGHGWKTKASLRFSNQTGCPLCANSRISKPQIEIFKFIEEKYPQYTVLCDEIVKINNSLFYADILVKETSQIFEYYGDFWHCHPEKYSDDYFHPIKKKCAKEIRKEDQSRIKKLKTEFRVNIIWEKEFLKNKSKILGALVIDTIK